MATSTCSMMIILHLFLVLLVTGSSVLAIEDFGEETTTMSVFIDMNPEAYPDPSSPSPETPDTTMKPTSILKDLEQVAWKIVQFEWNVTSALQRKLGGGPLVKAIRMRSEVEPALARIVGLVEGRILSNSFRKK
ncbi:unnamed protein product [Nezara viridula]|uniref:Neuropeptide n=1 Tax=Nezara viridula TaxID=85310 RepID=A0A9P0HQ08_NEZVI|nr:unnamed protein product [Nezara viridula]